MLGPNSWQPLMRKMRLLLVFIVIVSNAAADVSKKKPALGSCLCTSMTTSAYIPACGNKFATVPLGRCFTFRGNTTRCLSTNRPVLLQDGSKEGWIPATSLDIVNPNRCKPMCPPIVNRTVWGARQAKQKIAIRQPIPKVFVYHTAGNSCENKADCVTILKSIQNYHMDKHKWDDIGYNFLVGEDGNVYEGRGWDREGAHAHGRNPCSLGIAVMGTFTKSVPDKKALGAVRWLIACGVGKGKISPKYVLHSQTEVLGTEFAFQDVISKWEHYSSSLKTACP